MAQDAAKNAEEGEAAALPGRGIEKSGRGAESDGDPASIDALLDDTDSGWDVDAQVLTLQQAAATTGSLVSAAVASNRPSSPAKPRPSKGPPPLPRKMPAFPTSLGAGHVPPMPAGPGRTPGPPPVRILAEMLQPDGLVDLLQSRVTKLESKGDSVGLARAHVELALASETILGDDSRARSHAEAALRAHPHAAAAHGLLRRAKHSRSALPALLEHVEQELLASATETERVELLVEKARLLEALGGRNADARAAWEHALAHAPNHAAALKGLESELVVRALASGSLGDWKALAGHLGRMANAYDSQPALSAWLHVERARLLERKLDQSEAARSALEQAVELDPRVGPVRDALVRHLGAHGDWTALAMRLEQEARIDPNNARATRFELDAAAICTFRLGDPRRACELLDRAAARAPTAPAVDRRVLDELVRLNEREGHWKEAARARRARLRFVTNPSVMAYELRALATAAERGGDSETAVADVQRALSLESRDPTLVEWLDRLLTTTGRHDQRITVWLQESARAEDAARRAHALVRAAKICEDLGRRDDAVRHLRSAWVAAPGDPQVLDALARLLTPAPSPVTDAGARSLVELYAQAAEQTDDPGRKVAYIERIALLWEEVLGDPARAARAHEHVLALDPDRRSAVIGLARTASRLGDGRTLARALLDEARLAGDPHAQRALRVRAATSLAANDPGRAMAIVREVLDRDASHATARALETRLCEDGSRWELAAKSLRSRVDQTTSAAERVALWLSLAQLQHARLHTPLEALASLERARAIDPSHPVPPDEMVRILEDHGDAKALRNAVERLAATAQTSEERARQLGRAAEIDELRLDDDVSATRTYQRALAEAPEDDLLAERLSRVIARRARQRSGGEQAELAALFAKRIERTTSPAIAHSMSFDLAWMLAESGQEPMRAASLLESVLGERPDHIPALRALEALKRRAAVDVTPLARVLARQAAAFGDVTARLGALWNLAALEEWSLANGQPASTYRAILELDPSDPGALEAVFRFDLADARRGEPRARASVISALRGLIPFAPNDDTRLVQQLRLALMLESAVADAKDSVLSLELSREALERYRDALRLDPLSVTAATGLARTAERVGDAAATLAATESLAELADDARTRARCLLDGAEILLGPDEDGRLTSRPERRVRAAAMLERALSADPDSIPVAGRLATVLLEEHQGDRLVSAFGEALAAARSPDAIVMFGSEIARVARDELRDLPMAIDAMRHVRASVPQHVPSLLTLAELCIAQRVWPEAVDALEAVVSTSRETSPKLTALFALASIYEKVLSRPSDVDRVLRAALAIDPTNARALRALTRALTAQPMVDGDEAAATAQRREIAELLGRLADAMGTHEPHRPGADADASAGAKAGVLVELSEVQLRLGDTRAAERALVEAAAISAVNGRALARLSTIFRREGGVDHPGHARALAAVIARGEQLGHVDARWFAALGHVEIESLSRLEDGILHLQRAVDLDPALHETRFELARGHARRKAYEQASRVLIGMMSPTSHPLLSILDPNGALALLEEAFSAERRPEEAIVVSELRALAGDVDDARRVWLDTRRFAREATQTAQTVYGVLDRPTLITYVLPGEARHVLLEVAAAIAGVETKLLRSDLNELGISPRDRISARSGHPTRLLVDRVTRQLGAGDVELVVSPRASRVRVLAHDALWIVVPPSFVERPEPVQLAGLARVAARIAYGVPWLDELTPPQIEELLVAAARQVSPGYASSGAKDPSPATHGSYEASLSRALSRRQRKLLDELVPHLTARQSRPPPIVDFLGALARAELRAAFLVTGDLLAVVDESAARDAALQQAIRSRGPQSLAAVLDHRLAGDVARFALTAEATALRRRLGSTWTR